MSFLKTATFTVMGLGVIGGAYFLGSIGPLAGGDDEPVIVSGGSLHMMTAPDGFYMANKHSHRFERETGRLLHYSGNAKTKDRYVNLVEISYPNPSGNGARLRESLPSDYQTDVTVEFGYCSTPANCDAGRADDVVTFKNYTDSGDRILDVKADHSDVTADDEVFSSYWRHKPAAWKLSGSNIPGRTVVVQ